MWPSLAIQHEGRTYEVRLDQKAGHPLQVWRDGHKIAEALQHAYNPWSLQIADVDGDDIDEIAVGVTKSTHNLHFPHRTLFIMRFDGHEIRRKWTGSTMGRPLLEFCFSPKQKGKSQYLFTLEKRLDGRIALSANSWTGFGSHKVGHQLDWKVASGMSAKGDSLLLQANGRSIAVPWKKLI